MGPVRSGDVPTTADTSSTDVERPYRFVGGPWDGQVRYQPRVIVPSHCLPHGRGEMWAPADYWPGALRYAPTSVDGDAVVMQWREPTDAEITQAQQERAERYADEYPDIDDF
jgi:hypothetical protein